MGYDSYNKKVIKSGEIVEIWEYELPVTSGYKRPDTGITELEREFLRQEVRIEKIYKKLMTDLVIVHFGTELESKKQRLEDLKKRALEKMNARKEKKIQINKEKNRMRSLKRTIETATRLINANEKRLRRFLTLTFEQEMIDITEANKEFSNFIRRVRKHLQRKELERKNKKLKKKKLTLKDIPLPQLDYVAVIEFQTLTRDYVVHYHLLWTAPFIDQKELQQIWNLGHVWINAIDKEHATKNTGNYIMKYMKKSFKKVSEEKGEDFNFEEQLKAKRSMDKLFGRQRILRSEGLYEPLEIKTEKGVQKVVEGLDERQFEIGNEYESEFNGKIKYRRYNLKK